MIKGKELLQEKLKIFKFKVFKFTFLKMLFVCTSFFLFIFGIIIFFDRFINDNVILEKIGLYIFLGLIIITIIAFFLAKSLYISRDTLLNYLEKYNNCGGLLFYIEEESGKAWIQNISDIKIPELCFNWKKYLYILILALFFFILAIVLPISKMNTNIDKMNLTLDTTILKSKIKILEAEKILSKNRIKKLTDSLNNLVEESNASDPLKTWETLDNIKEELNRNAEEAAENDLKSIESLSMLREFADILTSSQLTENMTEQDYSDSLGTMKEMMNKYSNDWKKIDKFKNDKKLQALLNKKTFSKKELKELEKSLSKCTNCMKQSIKKMCNAKLIDKKFLKKCSSSSKCGKMALAEYLKSKNNCLGKCKGFCINCLGKPGVSRGRGDAAMTYKALGSNNEGTGFKNIQLAEDFQFSLDNSIKIGESFTAPGNDEREKSQSVTMEIRQSTHTGGYKHKILPKHKKILKKYFNTEPIQ